MKRLFSIRIFLCVLFFATRFSHSQEAIPRFESVGPGVGLKNDVVVDFIQDNNGFIWMATYNGLYRYDGIRCRYFNLQSEKLPFHFIIETACLVKMSDGTFLIGTRSNGILRFDPSTEITDVFIAPGLHPSLRSTTINSVLVSKNEILFGTDEGLFSSDNDGRHVEEYPGFPRTRVYKLYKSNDGTIWIGTHGFGLIELGGTKQGFSKYGSGKGRGDRNISITTMLERNDSLLWLGTWGNGLFSFNRRTKQCVKIPSGSNRFNGCVVKDIVDDERGNLWIATFAEGLWRYSIADNSFVSFMSQTHQSNSISNNTILRIFKDKADVVWVGTWGGHACYFDLNAPSIRTLMHESGNSNSIIANDVSAVLQESNGTLWITTYNNGVSKLSPDRNTYTSFVYPLLSNNSINSVAQTANGTIWIGSCNGLNRIDAHGRAVTKINLPYSGNLQPANSAYALYVDPNGLMWVGSGDGKVYMLDHRTNRFTAFESKVQPGEIHDFYLDRNNILWISGTNGLFKLDRDQKKVVNCDYYQDKNIPYAIRRILPLANGNLLLATTNNGLLEYSRNENSFSNVIPLATIGSISNMEYDSCRTIWMTTSAGLFSYDYATKELSEYAYQQGIQRTEYSCLTLLRDGNLAVGGQGLTFVNPYYRRRSKYQPPVVFTSLSVMDKQVDPGDSLHGRIILLNSIIYTKKIELQYSENIFTISFASLDYANSKRGEYRYRLEGFDADWHHTDAEKAFATYTNLDAGDYTLIVEAANAEKQWDSGQARIAITIIPPFWRTLWFKLICVLFMFWVIFSFYKQKMAEKQKEVEHMRNEKLQAEISNKEKILAAKNSELTSSVVHISNKNEILQEIQRELKSIHHKTNAEEIDKTITRIRNQISQNISTDNHWEQFEIHFNQLNHNFFEKLRKEYPELTQNNLMLCAYLRMNLSSKEIALLMNISPNAVLKSKYRLKLKFHLTADQDLMDFILQV